MDASPTKASNEPSVDHARQQYAYVGWVPTANGRLSFRHVGDARHPNICKYANAYGPNHKRVIFGFQKRNLSDLLFKRITERFTGRSGDFWFAVSCATGPTKYGDVDSLQGSVYIFNSWQSWATLGKNAVDIRIDEINKLRLNQDNHLAIETVFEDTTSFVAKLADITVGFELLRDGEVRFSLPSFRDSQLEDASEEYAHLRGVSFSKWASDQAYFFLRDLCHVHQHHSPHVDTILILQENNGKDLQWRNYILYSLHHYVIKMRRTAHTEDLYRALGILGYAKSFYEICKARDWRLAERLSKFNYEAIEGSLTSKIGENDSRYAVESNMKNWAVADAVGYRNLLIAVTVLIMAVLTFLMQPYIAKYPQKFEALGDIVVHNVFLITVVAVIVFCLIWIRLSEKNFNKDFYAKNTLYRKDFLALGVLGPRTIGWISTGLSLIIFVSVCAMLFRRWYMG